MQIDNEITLKLNIYSNFNQKKLLSDQVNIQLRTRQYINKIQLE